MTSWIILKQRIVINIFVINAFLIFPAIGGAMSRMVNYLSEVISADLWIENVGGTRYLGYNIQYRPRYLPDIFTPKHAFNRSAKHRGWPISGIRLEKLGEIPADMELEDIDRSTLREEKATFSWSINPQIHTHLPIEAGDVAFLNIDTDEALGLPLDDGIWLVDIGDRYSPTLDIIIMKVKGDDIDFKIIKGTWEWEAIKWDGLTPTNY